MNKELKELCERLIIGDILHTDFLIKVTKVVEGMSVEDARELARVILIRTISRPLKD